MKKNSLFLFAAILAAGADAQNADGLAQGLSYAETIKPSSAQQLVNPSAVDASSWSSTAAPSSAPTNLGNFSKSDSATNTNLYSNARGLGLTTLGNQKMDECADFVPGADDVKNQACAAVNFLSNRCMTATGAQVGVVNGAGITTGTGSAADCSGSYGQSVTNQGYQAAITPNDAAFGAITDIRTTAKNQNSVCTISTTTTPAAYKNSTCFVNTDVSLKSCSKYLNATVTTSSSDAKATDTCPSGVLSGSVCIITVSQATPTYACSQGYVSGNICVITNVYGATATTTSVMTSCPGGSFLSNGACLMPAPSGANGNALVCPSSLGGIPYTVMIKDTSNPDPDYQPLYCVYAAVTTEYSCPPYMTLSGASCISTVTTSATISGYTCPGGQSVSGTSCTTTTPATVVYSCTASSLVGKICISNTVTTSWTSTCGTYEAAAGTTLPNP